MDEATPPIKNKPEDSASNPLDFSSNDETKIKKEPGLECNLSIAGSSSQENGNGLQLGLIAGSSSQENGNGLQLGLLPRTEMDINETKFIPPLNHNDADQSLAYNIAKFPNSNSVKQINQVIAERLFNWSSQIQPPIPNDEFMALERPEGRADSDDNFPKNSGNVFPPVLLINPLQNRAESSLTNNSKDEFVCSICSKVFDMKFVLDIHMKLHFSLGSNEEGSDNNKAASYHNQEINLTSRFEDSLKDSPELSPSGNQNSTFVCVICSKVFNKKFKLTLHMKLHSSQKPFECGDCGARFKTKSYLSKHMVSHSDFKRFQCPECNKQCKRKVDLNHHMLTHGNIRPFECLVCKRTFKSKAYLNQHLLVHTDPILFKQHSNSYKAEGPIHCVICNKLFSDPAQLRHHLPSHSVFKPHQCPNCGMSFRTKSCLKKHLPCQEQETFQCTLCPVVLNNREQLNEHMLVFHQDEINKLIPTSQVEENDPVPTPQVEGINPVCVLEENIPVSIPQVEDT